MLVLCANCLSVSRLNFISCPLVRLTAMISETFGQSLGISLGENPQQRIASDPPTLL